MCLLIVVYSVLSPQTVVMNLEKLFPAFKEIPSKLKAVRQKQWETLINTHTPFAHLYITFLYKNCNISLSYQAKSHQSVPDVCVYL